MIGAAPSRPVVVVAGPTASGKSRLALDVAAEFGGTVINADSMQVYRELPILSAAPDAVARARVPHRLYGVIPAAESCSAGRWRELALAEVEAAAADARLPIIAGGSGLYLRALISGLNRVPTVAPEIRAAARARLARSGAAAMHTALAARDPVMAARLLPTDSQRLVRAWEGLEATGKSLSEWQRPPAEAGASAGLRFLILVLLPPRPDVYAACDARFHSMVAGGAVAEVAALAARRLDPALPAMKALGVPELMRHLAGEIPLEQAVRLAQQATRRYAKRQMTWLRHQLTPDKVIGEKYSERLTSKIFSYISSFLLTWGN